MSFCGLGPDEGVAAVVPVGDEGANLGIQVANRVDAAAPYCLAFDDAEPDLDQFSHDPEVGVKWVVIRGLAASQSRTSVRLWVAQVSITKCSCRSG